MLQNPKTAFPVPCQRKRSRPKPDLLPERRMEGESIQPVVSQARSLLVCLQANSPHRMLGRKREASSRSSDV